MDYFKTYFSNAAEVMSSNLSLLSDIEDAANKILITIRNCGVIYICGNGGSASDAQHIAAEIIGRYKHNRKPLPAICINTDTSALTAIANDYGYEEVFARQLEGLASPKDFFIAISTSGNSPSIVNALNRANQLSIPNLLLTGKTGGKASLVAKQVIKVNSEITSHIQESHIAIGQAICGYVEKAYL